jgi:hypothetical protein
MKKLKSAAICVLLTICYVGAFAQISQSSKTDYVKPSLFSDLPEKLNVNVPS